MRPTIGVSGLAEFQRGLKKLDGEAPKQLRIALNSVADLLVNRARQKVPVLSGAARASIKARSTRTSARVAVGGRKAPYLPWLDFGGKTGRNRSVDRPFHVDGRYVFVALKEIRGDLEKALDEGIRNVARGAGIEVD